jgi:hypothetical protein
MLTAYRGSIKIRPRVFSRLSGAPLKSSNTASYYMTTNAVFIRQGSAIITVVRWDFEAFVSVLVHEIMGVWPEPKPNYSSRKY